MITKPINDEINEKGVDKGYILFPFGPNSYKDIDDLFEKIESLCTLDERKYIYAYNTEPDSSMHVLGTDATKVKDIIKNINDKIEMLSRKLTDTIIFVVADHGHINIENIMLDDYKDLVDCLKRNTSLEARAVNFYIKENKLDIFPSLFNKYFKEDFDLYSKKEIIDSGLFGDGVENDIHERDYSFMKRVSDNSIEIAKKFNWDFIECAENEEMRSIEDIHEDVYKLVKKRII